MKKIFTSSVFLIAAATGFCQSFTNNNLVVLRVGNGTDALKSTGSPVFLDEYSQNGAFVQSVALPTTSDSGKRCILGGLSPNEGMINRTSNGKYVMVAGYDADLGGSADLAASDAGGINRSLMLINGDKAIDATTAFDDYANLGSPQSTASLDGTKFWLAGSKGGVRYGELGATFTTEISTTTANVRYVVIGGSQLYVSSATGAFIRVGTVGVGLPVTSGKLMTNLPAFPTNTFPNQFILADLSPAVPGLDVLYVADDVSGILKYSFTDNGWVSNGSVGTNADDYRGLTGDRIPGGGMALYLVRKGGSTVNGGGELVSLIDNSGYNAPIQTTVNFLAAAPANTSFRGVSLTPTAEALPLGLLSFTSSKTNSGNLLFWTTASEFELAYFELQRSTDGRSYSTVNKQTSAGDAIYNQYAFTDKNAPAGTLYYRLRSVNKNGKASYSQVIKMTNVVKSIFSVWPNPATNSITIKHPVVTGKAVIRVLKVNGQEATSFQVPEGSYQTSLNIDQLAAGIYRVAFSNGSTVESSMLVKK